MFGRGERKKGGKHHLGEPRQDGPIKPTSGAPLVKATLPYIITPNNTYRCHCIKRSMSETQADAHLQCSTCIGIGCLFLCEGCLQKKDAPKSCTHNEPGFWAYKCR